MTFYEAKNNEKSYWASKMSIIAGAALVIGFVLTILSWMEVCTSACVEGHSYRLFSFKFELVGMFFFSFTLVCYYLGKTYPFFAYLTGLLFAAGIGAELFFIYVQKYIIGSWCPVCLSIAATVGIGAVAYFFSSMEKWKHDFKEGDKMVILKRNFPFVIMLFLGFFGSFLGLSKANPLAAAERSLKENIAFGDPKSPVEVYVFTDWLCGSCHKIDPLFKIMMPNLEKKAKVYFIDANIHEKSMNFTPYNMSFMIYNKDKYFDLRKALIELSEKTDNPTETDVIKAIAPLGVKFKDLSFSDVALGVKMFKNLKRQFNITTTPTVVIINIDTKKGKKLTSTSEITETNILRAVDALKS